MESKRGRPKKRELISLEEALKLIEEKFQRPVYTKGTLYNKISKKELTRHGPKHKVLLDKEEVLEKLCS